MISYQCIPGYRVFGQMTLRCLGSGKWSRMNGRCSSAYKKIIINSFKSIHLTIKVNFKPSKFTLLFSEISCGKPQIQPGIMLHGRSYLFQDQLTYVCSDGKKRGVITCQADGKWNESPKCNGNKDT